jgi:hypothetical protein
MCTRTTCCCTLMIAAACARHLVAPTPEAGTVEPLAACDGKEPIGTCFPLYVEQGFEVAPLVVGPGRIQVLTPFGLTSESQGARRNWKNLDQRVVIDELTFDSQRRVASGLCPGASRPRRLINLVSGQTGVVCLETDNGPQFVVHIGATSANSDAVVFSISKTLDLDGFEPDWIEVADLGDTFAVVYPVTHHGFKHPSHSPWVVEFTAEHSALQRIEGTQRLSEAPVMLVVGHALLLLFPGPGGYDEVSVRPERAPVVSSPAAKGQIAVGELRQPCLAQENNGTVTISLPFWHTGESVAEGVTSESANLTLGYEHTLLPSGPDVMPTRLARCTPTPLYSLLEHDLSRRGIANYRKFVRSALDDRHYLIVSIVPSDRKYSGSLRIERK